jgi:hypothetical protein
MTTPEKGLRFYPASHRYRLDGKWVDGVTTLIKGGMPAPALMYWSARSVAEYVAANREQVERLYEMGAGPMVAALKEVPWQARDEAAVKGTDVHMLAEQIVGGEEVDVPEHLVSHVEACVAFLDEWAIKPLLVEESVASREHGYAGTLDLVAESKHAPLAIFDYKTSKSGIFAEAAFQENAYAHAEFYGTGGEEHPLPDIKAAFGVQIRADGWDVHPLEFGEHVFEEFLAIADVARIAKRAKGNRTELGYVKPAWASGDEDSYGGVA